MSIASNTPIYSNRDDQFYWAKIKLLPCQDERSILGVTIATNSNTTNHWKVLRMSIAISRATGMINFTELKSKYYLVKMKGPIQRTLLAPSSNICIYNIHLLYLWYGDVSVTCQDVLPTDLTSRPFYNPASAESSMVDNGEKGRRACSSESRHSLLSQKLVLIFMFYANFKFCPWTQKAV